jgi:hypothetical protein
MDNKLSTLNSDNKIAMSPALISQGEQIAKDEGIPLSGLTVLGGKFYINVTGLDVKMMNKCEKEHLILLGVEYIPETRATKEDMRASGFGVVRLFDKIGFEKAMKNVQNMGMEMLNELKKLYIYEFKMRGFASPATLKMSTMQNIDNVEMMAERRATNRAKREAVGTGLTSADEMVGIAEDRNVHIAPSRKPADTGTVAEEPSGTTTSESEVINEDELRTKLNNEIGEFAKLAGLDGQGISNVIGSTMYKHGVKTKTTEDLTIPQLTECWEMFRKISEANKK